MLSSQQNTTTPTPVWTVVDIAHFDEDWSDLRGVAAISADDVWVVGSYEGAGRSWSLTLHWDGFQWTRFPCPGYALNAVSGSGKDDVWAVGVNGIYHWGGTSWNEVSIPAEVILGELYSITAISANDIWAVGYYQKPSSGDLPLTMHWNGKQWAIIPGPNDVPDPYVRLYSVAAVSPRDVWAVGSNQNQTLTLHWDGNRWGVVPSPNKSGRNLNYLTELAVNSRNDIWAVGTSEQRGETFTADMLLMHWNGVRWTLVPTADIAPWAGLVGIAAISRNDMWAVGSYQSSSSGDNETLTMHWDGARWSVIPSPNKGKHLNYLSKVAALPSGDVWAVGWGSPDLLLLHTSSATGIPAGMPRTGRSRPSDDRIAIESAIATGALLALGGLYLRHKAFEKLDKEKEHA